MYCVYVCLYCVYVCRAISRGVFPVAWNPQPLPLISGTDDHYMEFSGKALNGVNGGRCLQGRGGKGQLGKPD